MRLSLCLALAASIVPAAVGAQPMPRHHARFERLPPVAGTIRVVPGAFGREPRAVVVRRYGPRWPAPEPQIVTGGLWPAVRPAYGTPAYGPRLTPGMRFADTRRWATGGTGLAGLIGNTGNPFAGEATWGTADSATTGTGLFGHAWERSPTLPYGAPAAYPASYGSAPQLGFYGSGTPYTMSYYSSGSSAGPYGSPGGLATYRSGSYGYGPRLIRIPYGARTSQRCSCGPRIVHLGRRHHRFD